MSPNDHDPPDLTAIARDPDAFERFYRRHVGDITRFVARRVADPHTVADLTADVFLAAIDSAPTYRPHLGNQTAWLYGVARNVVSAEHRRASRQSETVGRIAGRRLLDNDDILRLEERIDAESAARNGMAALTELPSGERAVFELVVMDQLTVVEAAAALRIRPTTARVRLHRARRKLSRATSPATDRPCVPNATALSTTKGRP